MKITADIIKKWLASERLSLTLIAVLLPFAVAIAHRLMVTQSPVAWIWDSQVTLNFIIALGMWGYFTEWYARKRHWDAKRWALFWVIGTSFVFACLRILGMETRIG